MPKTIEFNVPPDLTPTEVASWLSVLAKLVESNEGLAMNVAADVDLGDLLAPNPDWASIIILLGRCPGRNDPPIMLLDQRVDPNPDARTIGLGVVRELE